MPVSVPVSIIDAITDATTRLGDVSDSARLDAEILVARAIDMPRSYLFAHPEDTLDDAAISRLKGTVERRLAGEPMAYISGIKEFWSLELMVTPATLVPRPETEVLVELALREIKVVDPVGILTIRPVESKVKIVEPVLFTNKF